MTHALPHIVLADSVPAQAWKNGGGQTRELLAWPPGPDWHMRVSRADIASDGPFSSFPGVERWFVVLEGAGVTLHFAEGDRTLRQGDDPLRFDGAAAPGCTQISGATQDLNLMVRNGTGLMAPVQVQAPWKTSHQVCGLYTRTGGTWLSESSEGSQSIALAAHTLLWSSNCAGAAWRFIPHAATGTEEHCGAWWLGFTPEATAHTKDGGTH